MKVRIALAPNKFAEGGEIPPYRTGDPSILKRDLNNRVILPSFNDLFSNHRPEDIYEEEGYIPQEQGKGHQYTYNDIYTDYIGRLNKYNQSLPVNDSANILTNEKRTSQGLNRIGDTGAMPVVNDMFKSVNTLLGYGMQVPVELAKTALMPGSYIPYVGATNHMGELMSNAVDNTAGALFAPIMPSNYIDWGSAGRDGIHLKLPWQHSSNGVETPAFMLTMDFVAAPYLAKGVNQAVKYGKQYVNPFYEGRNQPVNLINEKVDKVELVPSEFDQLFEKYDPLFKKLATENIEYNPKKYVSYPYEYRDEKIGLFKPAKHGRYRRVSEDFPFFKSALELAELENKNSISVAEPQYFETSTFDSYTPNILNIRKYPSPIKPNPVKTLEGTYYDYTTSPMIQDNVRRLVHWMPEHTKHAAERYLDTGDLKSILQDETLTLAEKRQIADLGRYNSYVIDPNTNLFYTNVKDLIKNNKAIAKEINALSKAEQREVLNAAGMNTVDDVGNPINVVPKGVDNVSTRGHEINHAFQRKAGQPSNMRKMIDAVLPTKQYNKEGRISGNELKSTGSSALMDEKGSTIQDARAGILSSKGLPPDTPMETLNSIIDKMSNEDLLNQYRTVYGRDYIEEIKKIPNYNYDALREITKYGFKYGGNLFPDGGTLEDDDIPMYGSTQQEAVVTGHRMPAWNRFWNKNFRSKSGWDKYVDRYYARQQQMQDTNNTPNSNYEVPDALSIAGIIAGTPYNEDIERAKIWDTYNNWKEHSEIIGPHYDPDGNYHNDAYANPSAGYLSGTDPVGEFFVLNEALGPLAKFIGRGAQQVMAKAGNQWARNQVMGRAFNNAADASFGFNNRFVTTPANSVGYEIKPNIRTKIGDVEINNPNLMYHTDLGDGLGQFNHIGASIKNGYLTPGPAKIQGQKDYTWWNLGKPYRDPKVRLTTTSKYNPDLIHVRSTDYPIGQWPGKKNVKSYVLNTEYVAEKPIDVAESTYLYDPAYGYRKTTPTINSAKTSLKFYEKPSKLTYEEWTPEQWTAAQDAAIARGDMGEAQRLRDLHFNTFEKPQHYYRGSNSKRNTYFRDDGSAVWITPDKKAARHYATTPDNLRDLYVKLPKNIIEVDGKRRIYDDLLPWELPKEIQKVLPDAYKSYIRDKNYNFPLTTTDVAHYAKKAGYPVVKFKNVADATTGENPFYEQIATREYNNIKLADAVTYDDNGVRIPLGERDNFNINDIRYGLAPLGFGIPYLMNNNNNQ